MDNSTDLLADKVLLGMLATFVLISTVGAIEIADLKARLTTAAASSSLSIQTASLNR